jgi:cell division protein FtsW
VTPRTRRQATTAAGNQATPLTRRHRPDYQIVLFMGILVLLGVIVLYAISPARVELINQAGNNLDQAHFMQKQLLYLAIGLGGFTFAASMTTAFWKAYTDKLLLLGFGACFLLALLGLFLDGGIIIETGGATRWFNFGIGSFQPAELLKFGLLLYIAGFLGRRMQQGKVNSVEDTLVPIGLLMALASLFVIVFQKDMGTGITMFGMVLAMLVISGLRARLFAICLAVAAGLGIMLIITSPHRIERVMTFFDPSAADVESYHITQAAIALGSGGLTGKGLGKSVQAFGYLPEAVNDSIFAILGETFGFIGLIVILLLFFMLLRRLLLMIDRLADPTMRLIVAGVFGLIMTHVVVNVGAMTGIFPLTGVTLPFLSFGGTSLLFMMLGLGLVFHISRYTSHRVIDEVKESDDEGSLRRGRVGRSRYAGSRRHQRA